MGMFIPRALVVKATHVANRSVTLRGCFRERPQPFVSQQAKQRNVAESRSHAPDAPRTLVPTQSGQQLQQIDQRGVGCCWQAAVLGDAWTQETRSCARWIDQQ